MRRSHTIALLAGSLATVLLAGAYLRFVPSRPWRAFHDAFASGDLTGWRFYGGNWVLQDGVLENLSAARGDRAQVGSTAWTDYIVETELRLNADADGTHWGDAGVVIRVTEPSIGVDAYDGYYVGIGLENNVLFLGRSTYSWTRLSAVPLGAPARRDKWYRLRVLAKGCYFEAVARDLAARTEARLEYFDHDCTKRSGAAGIRTFSVPASYRNFLVQAP